MLIPAATLATLMPFEVERIVEALRRDMRNEQDRIALDPEWAEVHRIQARQDKDLLELLNPKQRSSSNSSSSYAPNVPQARESQVRTHVNSTFVPLGAIHVKHIPLYALYPEAASNPSQHIK